MPTVHEILRMVMGINRLFALFVDVMGVQQRLAQAKSRSENKKRFAECREMLEDFHKDLEAMQFHISIVALHEKVPVPSFVAEFSDAAYIVAEKFVTVAVAGAYLMRKALCHEYPLRGGIGVGSFSHETSGARTIAQNQVWSTSSFLGSAVVTAYQAERIATPGLRIFIHPHVLARNTEPYIGVYPMRLPENESTDDARHELRHWQPIEVAEAKAKLRQFKVKQQLSTRAERHYDATLDSYDRFGNEDTALPFLLPAL